MGMQVIICVEASKESKSDTIYIRNTIRQFYKIGQADVRFTYVCMGGKGNYSTKKIDKEIKDYVKQYKVGNPKGESVVIMCFDYNHYPRQFEQIVFGLKHYDADRLIVTINQIIDQLSNTSYRYGIDISDCPRLSTEDFWIF